jgi:uncharacterized protein
VNSHLALRFDGPEDAATTFVFAHGAGAGMHSAFMSDFARGIAEHSVRVVRFEFPYMSAAAETGRRGPPDGQPVLRQTWAEAVGAVRNKGRLFIGGKSLGGRIASLVADLLRVDGLICLGYPFHPPGRPRQLRTAHLESIATPTLIVQGTRDPLGSREEVGQLRLSPAIRIEWLEDGDHSFKPRVRSGRTQTQNVAEAMLAMCGFMGV